MSLIQKVCLVLTIIGAINWGLVGLFEFNVVESLFGIHSLFTAILYMLIGIAGIINILLLFEDQK